MSDELSDDKSNSIQVIARAARILNVLSDEPGGMRLAEISRIVNLPRSTVQRIVSALCQEELVQADRGEGVRLGPALMRMIGRVHTDVVAITRPHLELLSKQLRETVVLCRMSGRRLAYVHAVVAEHVLRVTPGVGGDLPLHCTSGGRALLALHPEVDDEFLLGADLEKMTEATVTDAAEFRRIVAETREAGFGWESEESMAGVSSMAVAIDTVHGQYAVAIVAPTARALPQKQEMSERLLKLKADLQVELGTSNTAN